MTINQLTCFLTLAKHLNYTSASNALYISQPTLSRTIVSLENELGNHLFLRDTRSVQLTNAGKCFCAYAEKFIALYNEAISVMDAVASGKRGSIRVGLSHFAAGELLPSLKLRLKDWYPDMEVLVTDGTQKNLLELLSNNKIDFLFTNDRVLHTNHAHYLHMNLYEIPLMVFVPPDHPFTRLNRPLTIEDLYGENLLTMEPTAYNTPPLSQLNIPVERQNTQINSQVRILSMIENGEGIALLHTLMKARFITTAIPLPFQDPIQHSYRVVALWSRTNPNPSIPYFLEVLRDVTAFQGVDQPSDAS